MCMCIHLYKLDIKPRVSVYVKQVLDLRPTLFSSREVINVLCFGKSIQQFTPFTFHGKSMIIYIMITNDLP